LSESTGSEHIKGKRGTGLPNWMRTRTSSRRKERKKMISGLRKKEPPEREKKKREEERERSERCVSLEPRKQEKVAGRGRKQ